jgi:ATP-dependent Lhr-like helicase
MRLGRAVTGLALVVLTAIATAGTLAGAGPFTALGQSAAQAAAELLGFIVTLAVVGLAVAAASERRRSVQETLAPAEFAQRTWTRDDAITEVVRGRLQALGPVTADRIAESMTVPVADVLRALARLAGEGVAMSGIYTPGAPTAEWCDRTLLARIHRYTVSRLRQEIEPVSTQDFMRFLFRWQHVAEDERHQGPDALDAIIGQLQGFEAPAAAWEAEILPLRLADYEFTWLDDLCLAGRAIWTRLTPPAATGGAPGANVIRTTPVTILPRRTASVWARLAPVHGETPASSSRARAVAEFLRAHGASFHDEIVDGTRLLRTQVEEALAELVAQGRVTSDSFAGLRALVTPAQKRKRITRARRHGRGAVPGVEDAGRWALTRRPQQAASGNPDSSRPHAEPSSGPDPIEHVAHALPVVTIEPGHRRAALQAG